MNTSNFFHDYYNNAEVNSIIIMSTDGIVLDMNRSFTNNFGYTKEDLKGKNFQLLFTTVDKEKNIPQKELEKVAAKGQAWDENFVVDKSGHHIWCLGESLLVSDEKGSKYIVKDIVNLQANKHVHLFMTDTEELLHRIFHSAKETPMLILDGSIKVEKVNPAFLELFEINHEPAVGCRLSDLQSAFWAQEDIRNAIRLIIVNNSPLKDRVYSFKTGSGENKTILLNSKLVENHETSGKHLFILIDDLTH